MTRTTTVFTCGLLFIAWGCGAGDRQPDNSVDYIAIESPYEFKYVTRFSTTDTGWFQYADSTPGGVPNTLVDDPTTTEVEGEGSGVPFANVAEVPPRCTDEDPPRCADTEMIRIQAHGHDFWGSGFANWTLNTSPTDASAYEGVSFWVRSAPIADKTFLFYVDDPRTILLPPTAADGSWLKAVDPTKDLDGDGYLSYGDIAPFTECRFPPPEELGEPACYNGGMNAPSAVTREPASNECGNAFHTVIHMTQNWQLVLIPWSELVQWPCPNRLEGGINTAKIAKFEIKLDQGTTFDFWIDNIGFYRHR